MRGRREMVHRTELELMRLSAIAVYLRERDEYVPIVPNVSLSKEDEIWLATVTTTTGKGVGSIGITSEGQ